jgi:RNA polymerase-binding transcription factor DksA
MVVLTVTARLEEMLAELDGSIATLNSESPERRGSDAGTGLCDADRVEASLEAMLRQRGEVVAALARAIAGTYGRCADCDDWVPDGRLEARPEAARCVNCQSKYAKAHR